MPNSKGRGQIVERLARLLQIARTHRMMPSLHELAAELHVHPRTVRRDMEALRQARIPLPPQRAYNPIEMKEFAVRLRGSR